MKLYITHLNSNKQGEETVLAILNCDKVAPQIVPLQMADLSIEHCDTTRYLDLTTVDVPGSSPIVVTGGYDQATRDVGIYVKCEDEPVLTFLAHCREKLKFNPCAIVRMNSGAIIQFLVEADG